MTELSFRAASRADLPKILDLLTASGLPLEGVEAHVDSFLVVFQNGGLVACAGLERYGVAALLRSVAVAKTHRGNGLGQRLVAQLVEIAHADGIESLVLLTVTKTGFFERFGFQVISRADAPAAVQYSVQFQTVCPASAKVMRLDIPRAENLQKGQLPNTEQSCDSQSTETRKGR